MIRAVVVLWKIKSDVKRDCYYFNTLEGIKGGGECNKTFTTNQLNMLHNFTIILGECVMSS